MPQPQQQKIVFLLGPPAVGKMTVGLELERLSGLRLFHNHETIELALKFFNFGEPPFRALVRKLRHAVFEAVVASDLPGLTFTYVWAFDDPDSANGVDEIRELFAAAGWIEYFVELSASQGERVRRNQTPLRLERKPSKRDIQASTARLLQADAEHTFESHGYFNGHPRHVVIDTDGITAAETASRVAAFVAGA